MRLRWHVAVFEYSVKQSVYSNVHLIPGSNAEDKAQKRLHKVLKFSVILYEREK
jgi:hypothetical protein